MLQIRIHGRGGQGVVTAAEMLALAGFMEKHHAQAFPSFGSERTGAPVVAFARLASHEIRVREPVLEPNVVLVQDRTLLDSVNVFEGLQPDKTIEGLGLSELAARLPKGHCMTVPATRFALEKIGRPLPGAGMLAGMAAMTGMMKLDSVIAAYNEKFSGRIALANAEVAKLAFDYIAEHQGDSSC